jgi:mitochondrial fission protein ELM1
MTLKPNPVDPDTIVGRERKGGKDAPATIGLLVGGNTGTIRYDAQDWDRLVDFMRAQNTALGSRWLVSNSRRTPAEASDRLARLVAEPGSPVADFIDVRAPVPKPLSDLFANSEAIVATVDSSSMVSEAVWARKPVIVVAPASSRLPDHEQEYRDYLAANGWVRSMEIGSLTPERLSAALGEITPLTDNPLDRLAKLLSDKLPAVFETTPH